jgi:predicted acetyltransferase
VTTIELVPVAPDDKSVLTNLVQFYCYDFSSIRGYDVTEHGSYIYRWVDHFFVESDRDVYFVRIDGALAGFVMTRALATGEREMSEFFVMRRHRRGGVGTRVAQQVVALHPGRWHVAFDDDNVEGAAFWPGVVERLARGPVERSTLGPPTHRYVQTVLRFSTVA